MPVELLIALDHESLEREEILNSHDLVDDLLVHRVLASLLASLHKLLVAHTQLSHQLGQQVLHELLEVLRAKSKACSAVAKRRKLTYVVNFGEL